MLDCMVSISKMSLNSFKRSFSATIQAQHQVKAQSGDSFVQPMQAGKPASDTSQ